MEASAATREPSSAVDLALLAEFPLFAELPAADLARLVQLFRRRQLAPGAVLIAAEQPGEAIYVLYSGTVKIVAEMADGKQVILAFLGVGDTVGEMSLLDSAGRSATVVALEPCTVLAMDRAAFNSCLSTMPRMTYNLVRLLSSRLRLANAQIQSLSTLDVAGRLARQLLAFAERHGRPVAGEPGVSIGLRLTQTDLAELVGASRERVNQVMGDLKTRGLLSTDSAHRVHVHDLAGLRALVG